jgi:hypothetical protein
MSGSGPCDRIVADSDFARQGGRADGLSKSSYLVQFF